MILPDSTIEAAARAMHTHCCTEDWTKLPTHVQDKWRRYCRTALTAALPDLIEICAKGIENAPPPNVGLTSEAMRALRKYFARVIRSLLTTPEDK